MVSKQGSVEGWCCGLPPPGTPLVTNEVFLGGDLRIGFRAKISKYGFKIGLGFKMKVSGLKFEF